LLDTKILLNYNGLQAFLSRESKVMENGRSSDMKILVADEIPGKGISLLRDSGHDIDVRTGLKEEELAGIMEAYDALIVRSNAGVTDKVISASRFQVIGRVGVDNIDLEAATAKGILVMNGQRT